MKCDHKVGTCDCQPGCYQTFCVKCLVVLELGDHTMWPPPYCCRYKERGVLYHLNGNDCECQCHGVDAPHAVASEAK